MSARGLWTCVCLSVGRPSRIPQRAGMCPGQDPRQLCGDVTWYRRKPQGDLPAAAWIPSSQCPSPLATGDITCLWNFLWSDFLGQFQSCFEVINLGPSELQLPAELINFLDQRDIFLQKKGEDWGSVDRCVVSGHMACPPGLSVWGMGRVRPGSRTLDPLLGPEPLFQPIAQPLKEPVNLPTGGLSTIPPSTYACCNVNSNNNAFPRTFYRSLNAS